MTMHEDEAEEERKTCKRKGFAASSFRAYKVEGSPRRGASDNKQLVSWGCVLHFAPRGMRLSTANKVVEHGQVLAVG